MFYFSEVTSNEVKSLMDRTDHKQGPGYDLSHLMDMT